MVGLERFLNRLKQPSEISPVSPEEIDRYIGLAYKELSLGNQRWNPTPFFLPCYYDESTGDRSPTTSYETELPRFKGQNVAKLIDEKVLELKGPQKLRVLDIGCLWGEALAECAEHKKWKGKLDLYGISANIPDRIISVQAGKGIEIKQADAHFLSDIFRGKKFDLIISNGAVGCMVDQARVLEQIWGRLAPEGIGLVSGIYWPMASVSADIPAINSFFCHGGFSPSEFRWINWTRKTNSQTGEQFAYLQAVFKKNSDKDLSLPFIPVRFGSHDPNCPSVLVYMIDKKLRFLRRTG